MLALFVICAIFASSHVAESARLYSPRIVGGQKARIEDFKWQAALLMDSEFLCGGCIISPTKILSAAHCTENIEYDDKLEARVGSSNPFKGGVVKSIVKFRSHPDHNRPIIRNNDIAVLFLGEPLVFDATIGAIALAGSEMSLFAGELVTVSGFGGERLSKTVRDRLHSVSVPIIDNDQCKEIYGRKDNGEERLTKNMICAGYYGVGGKDASKGDSGGPLVYKSSRSGATLLVGIVSWGIGYGNPKYPGVYTKVSAYRDWIDTLD